MQTTPRVTTLLSEISTHRAWTSAVYMDLDVEAAWEFLEGLELALG